MADRWEENKHPRDSDGKFASKGDVDYAKEYADKVDALNRKERGLKENPAEEHSTQTGDENKVAKRKNTSAIAEYVNSFESIEEKIKALQKYLQEGKQNLNIRQGLQDKHIVGTKNYNQEIANGNLPSILTENAQKLIKEYAGKGDLLLDDDKNWTGKERFFADKKIGICRSKKGLNEPTNIGDIHYSNKGCHIVPGRKKR
ncbi:MAG: hypothetical protein IJ999_00965 [Clostridia bacterium]|nr:hypothetical protein [Clostridia bacterium]